MRVTCVAVFVAICCVSMTSGFKLESSRSRRDINSFISYISKNGEIGQSVVITDTEAGFKIEGGMHAVFDYKQNLITWRQSPNDKACRVAPFEPVMTLEQIRQLILSDSKFPMPQESKTLHLQEANNPSSFVLSPQSAMACEGTTPILMEPKTVDESTALEAVPLRPKRDIGWGEVLLIVVVIILL